jgi:xylulokinase
VPVELYQTDGSVGSALGAGVGAGIYKNEGEAFASRKSIATVEPSQTSEYNAFYEEWKELLETQLQKQETDQTILHTV